MNMIDFVMQNKDNIQKLFSGENDGEFIVPPEEFSFASKGVKVEWEDVILKFTLQIDPFTFMTSLMPDEMKEFAKDLKVITDPDVRRQIVELLEGDIKESVEQEKDMAKDNMAEAKSVLEDSEKAMNSVLDAISDIKHAWGIP